MRFTLALIGLSPPETPPVVPRRRLKKPTLVPLAFEFRRLLDSGEVRNRAEIARRYHISRAERHSPWRHSDCQLSSWRGLEGMMYYEKARLTGRGLRHIPALTTHEQEQATAHLLDALSTRNRVWVGQISRLVRK